MPANYLKNALSRSARNELLGAQSLHQAVLIIANDGTILDTNAAFEKMLGWSKAELVDRNISFLNARPATPDRMATEISMLDEVVQEGHAYRLRQVKTKDGRRIYVANRYYRLGDGDGASVVAFATDVSESFAREARARGRAAMINSTYAVIEFDLDTTILDVNEIFCKAMGYEREEVVGQSHRMFVSDEIMSEKAYQKFWQELREGRVQSDTFTRMRKDGSRIHLQASYSLNRDDEGHPISVLKVATDVTDQVDARVRTLEASKTVDEKLSSIVSLVGNANERSTSAATAASRTADTVQSAAEQVRDFEETSQRIAEAMSRSRQAVGTAASRAGDADGHIAELSDAAESMSSIVEIIQKVAGQINLLALNATIESARAGDAGRGFAVVAAEVKSLADQVEKSTNQIGEDISRVQSVSQSVVAGLRGISEAVQQVEESVGEAGEAVERQTDAARDIAAGMHQAATSVREIDDNLGKISSAVADADVYAREGSEIYREVAAARAS